MAGFRSTDRPAILSCLADDVEWQLPGAFRVRGQAAFDCYADPLADQRTAFGAFGATQSMVCASPLPGLCWRAAAR